MDQLMKTSAATIGSRLSRRSFMKGAAGMTAAAGVAVVAGVGSRRPTGASANAVASGYAFRTTTDVNLRTSSNNQSDVILVVPAGALVIDYDQLLENGYRGVDYNGVVGWIFDDFLIPDSASPAPFYTTTDVNLWTLPSTDSEVVTLVPINSQVLDYDFVVENGFRGVDFNGKVGWILDQYLVRG